MTNCCLEPEPPLAWLAPKLGFLLAGCLKPELWFPEVALADVARVVAPELDLVVVVAPELALLARGLSTGPGARGWEQGGQQGPGEPLHL